jgi:hypothetical protein
MTPAGIELATFRFVVQHLDHCATLPRSPHFKIQEKNLSETSQLTHPMIQRHITRDMKPRQLRYKIVKSHKIICWLVEIHRAFAGYGIGIILIYFNRQQVT